MPMRKMRLSTLYLRIEKIKFKIFLVVNQGPLMGSFGKTNLDQNTLASVPLWITKK
jgi:hypothetical protein